MTTQQFPGGLRWPTVVNTYAASIGAASPAPLGATDTESDLNIDNDQGTLTLPGLPFDIKLTPVDRLLKVTALSFPGGYVQVVPLDYGSQFPTLADFRAIVFQRVDDYALIRWTGRLWSIVSNTPGLSVTPISQFNAVLP